MAFAAAHRGLSAQYAENTVAAFRAAARVGFPCIELDIRMTSDHEVVVLHDAGIERTTDGNGRVADMKYDELRSYETGEGPVPRLDDVFTELGDWQGLWNIEVKARGAAQGTIDLVAHHGLADRALYSAMDPRALETAKRLHPEVPRGLIVLGPPDADDVAAAHDMGCTWINVDDAYVDPALVRRMQEAGLRVGVWTVNDADRARELRAMRVECVITDTQDVLHVLDGKARF